MIRGATLVKPCDRASLVQMASGPKASFIADQSFPPESADNQPNLRAHKLVELPERAP